MQASLIIQTLLQLIGQDNLKTAYVSEGFDKSVFEVLSSNNLPFVPKERTQSKFFEKGSILIHHEIPNSMISPYEFSILFQDLEVLPAHMNLIMEKSENGFWLNLQCMGEKPRFKVNFWNSETEKWLFDETVRCNKRFQKDEIKASIIGFPPYVIYNDQKEVIGSTDRDILQTLGQFMDFQIQWIVDNDWGRPSENGTWNGLLGKVQRQEAELGTGHVGMVWPRAQIIDYTHYTYFLEVGHKTRKPIPKNPVFNIFLPYTSTTWILITVSVFVTCITFLILGKCNGKYGHTFGWDEFLIMPTAMLMECSLTGTWFYKKIQSTPSGYIMVVSWVIATFFMRSMYESNLLASLLAKVYEDPIDSFQGKRLLHCTKLYKLF